MAMYHHDSRNYTEAANEARETMRANLQRGARKAAQGLQRLQERVIRDTLVPLNQAQYGFGADGLTVNGMPLTPQALGQLCQRADIHVSYARKLATHQNPIINALAVENFETMSAISDDTIMLRAVDGVIHGTVTDAFKRMDMRHIVGSFGSALQSGALLPVQCELSATRVYVRALMPRLYGEEYGEALAFGVTLRGSDFGFGKLRIDPFCERAWCTNRAQMTLGLGKGFNKQHRGARLTEHTFELSEHTQELHAQAMAAEMTDAVRALLSPESISIYTDAIGRCFAEGQRGGKYDAEREIAKLVEKRRLSEKQAKFVTEAYASNDRDVVPAGAGRWKLAQAIAYAAQHATDGDMDVTNDLEWLAGEIVESAPKNALPAYVQA